MTRCTLPILTKTNWGLITYTKQLNLHYSQDPVSLINQPDSKIENKIIRVSFLVSCPLHIFKNISTLKASPSSFVRPLQPLSDFRPLRQSAQPDVRLSSELWRMSEVVLRSSLRSSSPSCFFHLVLLQF